MKISAIRKAVLLVAIILINSSNLVYASGEKIVKVSNFSSFLKAIEPNVTIILTNEIDASFGPEELRIARNSKYLTITDDNTYYQPWEKDWTIKDVNNLKIIGQENGLNKTKITTKSDSVSILTFSNVKNVTLQNLDLGYPIKDDFSVGKKVLEISNSSNLLIKDTNLVGGESGLELKDVSDVNFDKLLMDKCSSFLALITNSKNVKFSSSSFKDAFNQSGTDGFKIMNSRGTKFENSIFSNLGYSNDDSSIFYFLDKKSDLDIKNSQFLKNNAGYFSNKSSQIGKQITESGNIYQNNSFPTPSITVAFKEIANQKYEKYYVHDLSGIKFYQAIPLNEKDAKNSEIIPYKSEVKLIRPEGKEILQNNIPGHWTYAEFQGRKGYLFDGLVSYFPVTNTIGLELHSYYKQLVSAKINSSFEQEFDHGEFLNDEGNLECCFTGYKKILKVQSCSAKDVFWFFKSYENLSNSASFPNKELIKNLIKSGKILKKEPETLGKKWQFWLKDTNEIHAVIDSFDESSLGLRNDDFTVSLNKDLEITSFKHHVSSEGGSGTSSIKKQENCTWIMEEEAFAD